MTAEEIYLKGIERMQYFYEKSLYGDGMHSTDYKRMIEILTDRFNLYTNFEFTI